MKKLRLARQSGWLKSWKISEACGRIRASKSSLSSFHCMVLTEQILRQACVSTVLLCTQYPPASCGKDRLWVTTCTLIFFSVGVRTTSVALLPRGWVMLYIPVNKDQGPRDPGFTVHFFRCYLGQLCRFPKSGYSVGQQNIKLCFLLV